MNQGIIRASLGISFNNVGLPGLSEAKEIAGALMSYGLVGCVVGLVLSAGAWALAGRLQSPHHAERGRQGALVCCGASVLIGSAPGLVDFFSKIHIGS